MEMAENIRMDEEVEKLQGQICKDGDPGGKKILISSYWLAPHIKRRNMVINT